MVGLLIVLALVAVPLLLVARLSVMMLARLFGVISRSEVVTRAEFARIREQMLVTVERPRGSALDEDPPSPSSPPLPQAPVAPVKDPTPRWRTCPECAGSVPSAARMCVHCGNALSFS